MFNAKGKTKSTVFPGQTSIIGSDMVIRGELTVNADIRIDGTLIGNITSSARVVLGAGGMIEGNVIAHRADINGKVFGNITTKELLTLKSEAEVNGDIVAGKLGMESTVQFNGNCKVTGVQPAIMLLEDQRMQEAV